MTRNQFLKNGEQARPVENENLLTYEEAGKILGLGSACLRQWASEGKLRVAKFNARVHRLFASDIQKLREDAVAA
jgi:predicted site-specific integrase-resolvase